jgi:CubicO group peptidase (beta-lactamase class C family)
MTLQNALRGLTVGLPPSHGKLDLPAAMALCHTPGVSMAIIDGGDIAETLCAGVLEAGGAEPVTGRTLFQAGSISKPVAAACALRLVADGVLDLDEDVNERLRSWQVPANDGWQPRITLRQLLSHTAATTAGGFVGYPRGTPVPSVPEVLDGRGNSMPVVVAGLPGLGFAYSGGGYTIMQQLLIDVTGKEFPALAAELVLEPAGMADSTFAQPLPAWLVAGAATGHHPGPVPVPGRWHTYPEMAAAGLWSTAGDLARFLLAIRAGITGAPGALLPQELAEAMASQVVDGTPYGLGLTLKPPGSIGHSGNDQGFENHAMVYVESGQGLVMMTNAFYGQVLIHEVVVPALHKALGWPGSEPAPAPVQPGRYGDFVLGPSGDDLTLSVPGQPPLRLSAGDDGRWQSPSLAIDVWLEGDTLVLRQDGATIRRERRTRDEST